ncbi:DUF3943 domain-containing protein [Corallococcus llansteffanensis]|uniref:DUF3943 domain-containing protein n=1 Tax=Corallococcus llansteffanensis TaxID=2316731 RepID=A0A3A8QI87_9BACT|nr:DUF3943 domain-containing protein [Corallococcus llansteffanensis]
MPHALPGVVVPHPTHPPAPGSMAGGASQSHPQSRHASRRGGTKPLIPIHERWGRAVGTMAVRSGGTSSAALVHLAMVLLLAAAFPAHAHEVPADAPLAAAPPSRNVWLALGEVTAANAAIWSVNRFIRKTDWSEVSPEVWGRNLTGRFEWDADKFTANQLDHPYHGGIYYNIGRDNGFSYWESGLLTFLGSLQWEVFGENNPPSTNDIINTSLGGLAVGEVLYRLSSMILDNSATGWERGGLEVAAGLLNPGRGLSRVVRGEAWRVGPTPRESTPLHFAGFARAGFLQEGDATKGQVGEGQFFLGLGLRSGDPFLDDFHKPFDSFSVDASFITRQDHFLSQAEVQGLLALTPLVRRPRWQVLLGAYQFYDYVDIGNYQVGAQSFSGSLLYRHELKGALDVRATLDLRGVALAAISTDPSETDGRGYDYGPGLGVTLRAALGSWPWEYAGLELEASWIRTLDGTSNDHLIQEGRLHADIPVFHGLGLGGSVQLFRRDSLIPHEQADTQKNPRFQVFVSWH